LTVINIFRMIVSPTVTSCTEERPMTTTTHTAPAQVGRLGIRGGRGMVPRTVDLEVAVVLRRAR
jgi:hypothetical protein